MNKSVWWSDWPFGRVYELSILDVVNSGTIDFKLGGLLWLLMEHRASVLVASGPIFAGKSTMLHSLLDFLPPGVQKLTLKGFAEDFSFTGNHEPDTTYLISEEISNHNFEYLWGYQVVKALELLTKGYAFGSTIHARNIKEVAYVLHSILNVPLPLIAGLGVVVTLQAWNGPSLYEEPIRRVDTVNIINSTDKGLVAQTLAARELTDKQFAYPSEKELSDALFNKFAVRYDNVFSEVAQRERFLIELNDSGVSSREEVRKAISDYYRSSA